MNAKLLFIIVLLILSGCNNRHATGKDVFLGQAKQVFHETILSVLLNNENLVVSNSVRASLTEFLDNGDLAQKTKVEYGTIVVNPDIGYWKKHLHLSRSNEVALSIQWVNVANESEYFSINFDGLIKPISKRTYVDSIKNFGKQNALIVVH